MSIHPIQQDILRRITHTPAARYSDLKSDEVDGNLFMYHLNQLMQAGYIQKTEKTYSLTLSGKRYVAQLSTSSGKQREQPQILMLIMVKNSEGKYALFRWNREPNAGLVSFPHGKMHFAESIFLQAQQELEEKVGLSGELFHRGDVYVRTIVEEQVFQHQLFHIFEVKDAIGELIGHSKNGEVFWGIPEDIPETELMPGTWEIFQIIQNTDHQIFLREIEVSDLVNEN